LCCVERLETHATHRQTKAQDVRLFYTASVLRFVVLVIISSEASTPLSGEFASLGFLSPHITTRKPRISKVFHILPVERRPIQLEQTA